MYEGKGLTDLQTRTGRSCACKLHNKLCSNEPQQLVPCREVYSSCLSQSRGDKVDRKENTFAPREVDPPDVESSEKSGVALGQRNEEEEEEEEDEEPVVMQEKRFDPVETRGDCERGN
ncbi:hypothetical protein KM043_014563 [Ampulex compressa]|nr:hypothetical protein KM043_014563 [Ampulex compressa]